MYIYVHTRVRLGEGAMYTGHMYRRLTLYAEVGFNTIMYYVHYRKPSGKKPNAPLSLTHVQAERLHIHEPLPIPPVLGNTNIHKGSTASM
jgi:hypothetical protein